MSPASGTILKYDLSPRNGRRRSISLEIEKSTRTYRLRARDYSRDNNVIAKSLGLKCPTDCYSTEEAVAHLRENPEVWLFFEGMKEQMEEGHWPKELRQKVTSSGITSAKRMFPHGSLGDMLRWYLKDPKIGSERQKMEFGAYSRKVLTLKMDRNEVFAHLDTSDLTVSHVEEMQKQWEESGQSLNVFRQGLTLLSAGLNHATARPEITGATRGPGYGIVVTDKMNLPSNPFNTVRKQLDAEIRQNRMDDPSKGPDPFDHEECRAIITVFRKAEHLRPYWPIVGLGFATGARPNELCALPWSNVLGLWKGFTMRSLEFITDPSQRQLTGGPVMLSRAVDKYNARHVMKTLRFKNTKNENERRPKLNCYITGYEDLFKMSIEARLPARLEITNLPEFRDMLVFQGPRAYSSHRADGETRTQYTQHRSHRPKGTGSGSSRTTEMHRSAARRSTGNLTHSAQNQFALAVGNADPYLPFDWHNFGRYWKDALELAGVRYRHPYQMRHTYVSLMHYHGHSFDQIAGWIGDDVGTMRARYLGRVMSGNLDM